MGVVCRSLHVCTGSGFCGVYRRSFCFCGARIITHTHTHIYRATSCVSSVWRVSLFFWIRTCSVCVACVCIPFYTYQQCLCGRLWGRRLTRHRHTWRSQHWLQGPPVALSSCKLALFLPVGRWLEASSGCRLFLMEVLRVDQLIDCAFNSLS